MEKMTYKDKAKLVLKTLKKSSLTANQCIIKIYEHDKAKNALRDNPFFYTHLNKLFSPLEKKGFITVAEHKVQKGTLKMQKVWKRTEKNLTDLDSCSLSWSS